jgi:hypothetical protein
VSSYLELAQTIVLAASKGYEVLVKQFNGLKCKQNEQLAWPGLVEYLREWPDAHS